MDTFVMDYLLALVFFLTAKVSSSVFNDSTTYLSKYKRILETAGYNEDALLNFTELTKKYGYPTEEHHVVTLDGYNLTLFRMRGKNCSQTNNGLPIILMHGLIDTSTTFIISGPGVGLGYLLADQCHDVWLPNNRGNTYSKRHATLDPNTDSQYWNFTFDQIGMFDLPAIVDYVLNETKSEKVNYIGHSQGNTVFYILNTVKPEYNKKFNIAICLAPIAWLKNIFSPILQLVSRFISEIYNLAETLNINDILDRNQPEDKVLQFLCQYFPKTLCGSILFLIAGANPNHVASETFAAVFGQYPAGTSLNNLDHYGQGVLVDKFRRYDYGREENIVTYGVPDPPEYDITKVTAPVILVCGDNDWLVDLKDVAKLRARLPNVVDYYVIKKDWSHSDYLWSYLIPERLAPKVFEYLSLYG